MNEASTENQPRPKRLRLILIVVVSLSLGLLAGMWQQRARVSVEDIAATVLEPAGALEDFALITHAQTPFTRDSLKGKWSFVFFGYTHCPDVCPTTLHTMTQVEKEIRAAEDIETQTIFVSVDPERDSPERLSEYVPYFSEEFVGVTGKRAEINRFTRQLGVLHVRMERDDEENYLVNHSSSILLFNPNGELRALFSEVPHTAEYITENFLKIAQL